MLSAQAASRWRVKQAHGERRGLQWRTLAPASFPPMRYSQVLSTQQAFVPIGDVVGTTDRHVGDGAGDGHHWVLLVNVAVHLCQTAEKHPALLPAPKLG